MRSDIFEIEVKFKLTLSADEFAKMLDVNGFRFLSKEHEVDTYYTRPDIDYMKTVECLRIRRRRGFCEMTYKPATVEHRSDGITTKKETNVRIFRSSDAVIAEQFLKNIGMKELTVVDKRRSLYTYAGNNNLSIAVDKIAGAGIFVEIEILSADVEQAQKELRKIKKELGFNDRDIVTVPYRDIVMGKS